MRSAEKLRRRRCRRKKRKLLNNWCSPCRPCRVVNIDAWVRNWEREKSTFKLINSADLGPWLNRVNARSPNQRNAISQQVISSVNRFNDSALDYRPSAEWHGIQEIWHRRRFAHSKWTFYAVQNSPNALEKLFFHYFFLRVIVIVAASSGIYWLRRRCRRKNVEHRFKWARLSNWLGISFSTTITEVVRTANGHPAAGLHIALWRYVHRQ